MSLYLTILGCGSSMGVPRPDGYFGNCDRNEKKNYRSRCSALIESSNENIFFMIKRQYSVGILKQCSLQFCLQFYLLL